MRILRITSNKSPGAHTDNSPLDCYLHAKASGIPEFNRPSGDGTFGVNLYAYLARHRKNVSERVDRKQSVMIHTESGTACGAERMTYERLVRKCPQMKSPARPAGLNG